MLSTMKRVNTLSNIIKNILVSNFYRYKKH